MPDRSDVDWKWAGEQFPCLASVLTQQVPISDPLNGYCAPERRNYMQTHSQKRKGVPARAGEFGVGSPLPDVRVALRASGSACISHGLRGNSELWGRARSARAGRPSGQPVWRPALRSLATRGRVNLSASVSGYTNSGFAMIFLLT